jgi:hypothetical protein
MNVTVPIALYSWPLITLLMFAVLKPRTAVVGAFLLAWLFLPMAGFEFEGLPSYTKTTATTYGVLAGILLFDGERLVRQRPTLLDLPMAVWCIVPLLSCLSNNIGGSIGNSLYGGAGQVFLQFVLWGLPWLIGRLYFSDLEGLRELAVGIVIGGLIYLPLCLYEIRMAPVLHNVVYGYNQHSFGQQIRFGGYRPMVFMQHGLAVGLWMANATLVALWLWHRGAVTHLRGVPMSWVCGGLALTTVLCKSTGAVGLLLIGAGALFASHWLRSRAILLLLVLSPIGYMAFRATGYWSGEWLVTLCETLVNEERAGSVAGRMWNEDLYIAHTWDRPILGWTSWNFQVYDEWGNRLTTSDGLWIIAFSNYGFVGLISLFAALLVPVWRFVRTYTVKELSTAALAPALVLGMVVLLFAIDSLFNAMLNPIFVLAAAGLAGFAVGPRMYLYQHSMGVDRGPDGPAMSPPAIGRAGFGWEVRE